MGGGRTGEGEKTAAVVSAVSKSRIVVREAGFSQAGGLMLARRWRLSRMASQRGRGVSKGGVRGGVGPQEGGLVVSMGGGTRVAWRLTTTWKSSGWTDWRTHSQELEAFQALAGDYCDELHFGEEADF